MKALLSEAPGPPETLRIAELLDPAPGPGELLVRVRACSINYPDVLIIEDKYQLKPPRPFAPGSEIAGEVEAVGEGVSGWSPGDRLLAATGFGGLVEKIVVPAARAIPLPADRSFAEGSALLLTYATAIHALVDRGRLQAGQTLLVLGAAGGVGIAAIEIGKILGARVIAAASTDEKLAICRAHGADATINYAAADLREQIKSLTGGNGVDVVYDPVGGPYSEPALRSLAWRGRLLVVGFAAGESPKIPLNLTLLKGCSIVGVFWGDFTRREPQRFAEAMARLGRWYADGKLKPHVSATFPLERAADALTMMANRQVIGKVVLTV